MRVVGRFALVVGLIGCLAWSPPPAQAAQTGAIIVGASSGVSVARTYFTIVRSCNAADRGTLNNTDAAIFDVGGRPAGSVLDLSWTGVVAPTGSLTPQLYSASCLPLATPVTGNTAPGVMRVTVPPGAKWLVVDGNRVANVSLTLP